MSSVAAEVQEGRERILHELRKVIVGHDDLIRRVLIAFFAGGHVLLEGVPGLGKTLLVKAVGRIPSAAELEGMLA